MKKYVYLSLLFAVISLLAIGQSQRLVLVEEATNASCGPCASQNPAFDALLQNNPDKLVAIKYHWYFPGYDPMHNHNVQENNARVSYYGINGVPHALIDGASITGPNYVGAPLNCTQAKLDNAYAIPSPCDIQIYSDVDDVNEIINVTMLIRATDNITAGMKAQMAVVEKSIHFASPPGSNTESDFNDVMKKMLPTQFGTGLPAFSSGEYKILQYSWEYQNVYDIDELAVVGFIQNNANKAVLQAAKSNDEPFEAPYSVDAEITKLSNVLQSYCVGNVEPHITFRNNGADNITSMTISYTINDGDPLVHQWSGDLAFLESETVILPESDFEVMESNIMTISLDSPNNEDDDYPSNNVHVASIPGAANVISPIDFVMKLDDNPEETSWELKDSEGNVLYSGGSYTTAGQFIIESLEVTEPDCYFFFIYDTGGDGLTGTGFYKLAYGSPPTYFGEGDDFGYEDEVQFELSLTGEVEIVADKKVEIYPNPTNQKTTVSFEILNSETVEMEVFNSVGAVVYHTAIKEYPVGNHAILIDGESLTPGVYFINLKIGNGVEVQKLIIK